MVEQFWSSLRLDKSMLASMNRVNFAVMVRAGIYCVLEKRAVRVSDGGRQPKQLLGAWQYIEGQDEQDDVEYDTQSAAQLSG